MRNLQKILALALALIMSFSLVVTANAAFSDEADITDTYNEAVNVLSQLEVFKGYTDGTYQPQKSITRAEVAAIIYRIATGDVTDTQVSIYSDWNRFTDVHAGEWWAGYINYCANAEYIKGYGNGKFGPDDPVTGYEALAMILRAVGYGKMDGEFQGSDWAVQTAARANTLKVTKNVQNSALLNSAATRELVAELLFRSILVPTVEYNQFSGYTENDTTLAYQSFGLEAIEGVVVANEWANLYDVQVLADGKTDLEMADGTVRHLDIASEITAVGEAHYAYISDSATGAKVYALENTGSNTVWEPENGEGTDISGSKFSSKTGMRKDDDTEFYVNFGREGHYTSAWRIEFNVTFKTNPRNDDTPIEVMNAFAAKYIDSGRSVAQVMGTPKDALGASANLLDTDAKLNAADQICFEMVIRADEEISQDALDIIYGIFAAADDEMDGNGASNTYEGIEGNVYAGSRSNTSSSNTVNRYEDLSDEISYRTFYKDYIDSEVWDREFDESGNGEWLKVVDNDGDGIADYAFLTRYYLDEATGTYTKSGTSYLEFEELDVEEYEDDDGVVVYQDEIAVGDVVLYTDIDNKIVMTKVDPVTATINTVNFKENTCTTTDGTTYEESDIFNRTKMDELVSNMEDKVEYNLYLDRYGYVRAYELTQDNIYGLVTELYYTRGQNLQYVTNAELTVEMKKGDKAADEYVVSNKSDTDFLLQLDNGDTAEDWLDLEEAHNTDTAKAENDHISGVYSVGTTTKRGEIVLQPAKSHLGVTTPANGDNSGNPAGYQVRSYDAIFTNATTNIAKYIETGDDEVRINSAAKLATDSRGDQWFYTDATHRGEKTTDRTVADLSEPVYEVDYIEIANNVSIAADARQYTIADGDYNESSRYVQAVDTTEFYVVDTQAKKFSYFVGYKDMFAIPAADIRAAYAVARNTNSDSKSNDYWVADVIVIEVSRIARVYDSIALPYYNVSQTSDRSSMAQETKATDRVRLLNTLNSESAEPMIDMIPTSSSWGNQLTGWRFYQVDENAIENGVLVADAIDEIRWTADPSDGWDDDYSDYGIYAGVITRGADLINYVEINLNGETDYYKTERVPVTNSDNAIYAIHSNRGSDTASATAEPINMRPNSDRTDLLTEGDQVIYVLDKDGDLAFMVNVSYVSSSGSRWAPVWLSALYAEIVAQQKAEADAVTFDQALKAYNEWVVNQNDDTLKAAKEAVAGALANKNITGSERTRLEEIRDILNGGTTTPSGDKGELVATDAAEGMGVRILEITKNTGTAEDPHDVKLMVANPTTTTIGDLRKALSSSIDESVTITAYTSGGTVLSAEAPISTAAEIIITMASGNVYRIVQSDIQNSASGYWALTLKDGVEAYLDAAYTKPAGDSVANGTKLWFKKNAAGTLYAVNSDRFDAGRVVSFDTASSTTSGVTTAVLNSVTCNLEVSFFPATNGEIKTLNLNPELVEKYGATFSGITADPNQISGYDYYIDITVDTKSQVPTSTTGADIGLLAHWFGIEINSEGLGSGNGYEGTGAMGAYYEPAGAGGKFVVTARGEDGGSNFAIAVYVEYKAPTTLKYEAEFTATAKSGVELTLTQINGDPSSVSSSPASEIKFFDQEGDEIKGLTVTNSTTAGVTTFTVTDDLGNNVTKISAKIVLTNGTEIDVPATTVLG